jgi:hypothetical protein
MRKQVLFAACLTLGSVDGATAQPVAPPSLGGQGAFGCIVFFIYVIFGPGMFLFELVGLARYYWLGKTSSNPSATIQWPEDPSEMKWLLAVGAAITMAPVVYGLLFGS